MKRTEILMDDIPLLILWFFIVKIFISSPFEMNQKKLY